jgi:hypothetical protein
MTTHTHRRTENETVALVGYEEELALSGRFFFFSFSVNQDGRDDGYIYSGRISLWLSLAMCRFDAICAQQVSIALGRETEGKRDESEMQKVLRERKECECNECL